MIYDMRVYDLKPGSLGAFMDAVREIALPLRRHYGIELAGWYYSDVGPQNRVVHIWAYRDYAHYEQARREVHGDPRWTEDYLPRVQGLSVKQRNMIMKAADFSPQLAGAPAAED